VRPDHHRVAVDRHAHAELGTRSGVVRRQLCNLRPAGGGVAGRTPITTVSASIDTL
jgi:hypothetical protein